MTTPVGHSLLGLIVVQMERSGWCASPWRWCLFAVVAASVPDLDYLPGLLLGDINRFHRGPTHSLTGAVVFGALAIFVARWLHVRPLRIAIIGTAIYSSHLLLDFFTHDGRAPLGLPLLWPFMAGYWIAPSPIFWGVKHGVAGDSVTVFMHELLSLNTFRVVVLEAAIFSPLLLLSWYFRRRRRNGHSLGN